MDMLESRKNETMKASADPACPICNHCWFQAVCIQNLLSGHKPQTCCTYQLFHGNKKELTLEEVIMHICAKKCVERQNWKGDPVPHTPIYCEKFCPVSRYLLNLPAPQYEDAPHNFGY